MDPDIFAILIMCKTNRFIFPTSTQTLKDEGMEKNRFYQLTYHAQRNLRTCFPESKHSLSSSLIIEIFTEQICRQYGKYPKNKFE